MSPNSNQESSDIGTENSEFTIDEEDDQETQFCNNHIFVCVLQFIDIYKSNFIIIIGGFNYDEVMKSKIIWSRISYIHYVASRKQK